MKQGLRRMDGRMDRQTDRQKETVLTSSQIFSSDGLNNSCSKKKI